MRGPGVGRAGLRRTALWACLVIALLSAQGADAGRSREAEEGLQREKELKRELSVLRKENKLRDKEAEKEARESKSRKSRRSKKQPGPPANGLTLLQQDAAAATVADQQGSLFSGLLRWVKEFFRWFSGSQPTEAEHAVERAKRTKNYLDSDYDIGGRYFSSRPSLKFRVPVTAERPRGTVFDVAAFGAVADGSTDCTEKIQRAIDEASAAPGGGVVVFGDGTWVTGPLQLRSHVTLWLSGARSVLRAHGQLERGPTTPYQEFPLQPAYEPRMRHRPLLGGHSLENVTIAGGGVVDGNGMAWWTRGDHERMRLAPAGCLHLLNVTGLTVRDTWFLDSPKFTIRPQLSRRVRIHNVVVDNPAGSKGTNGIVVDSCQDVEVTECVVSTGFKEDAMAVKSGEGEHGLRLDAPSRRAPAIPTASLPTLSYQGVTFRGCSVLQGHAVSIGSEMSGSVFDTRFEDIHFDGTDTHGYGAGSLRGVVDGVTFTHIRGKKMIHVLQIHAFFGAEEGGAEPHKLGFGFGGAAAAAAAAAQRERLLPKLRNIVVSNVKVEMSTRTPFIIEGLPDSPVTGLTIENVTVKKFGKRGWDCSHYGGCSWEGGGCAVGAVSKVEPPPPPGCVRLQAPALMRRG